MHPTSRRQVTSGCRGKDCIHHGLRRPFRDGRSATNDPSAEIAPKTEPRHNVHRCNAAACRGQHLRTRSIRPELLPGTPIISAAKSFRRKPITQIGTKQYRNRPWRRHTRGSSIGLSRRQSGWWQMGNQSGSVTPPRDHGRICAEMPRKGQLPNVCSLSLRHFPYSFGRRARRTGMPPATVSPPTNVCKTARLPESRSWVILQEIEGSQYV